MNKKEFKQWVKKTYRDFQKDKQAIAYSGCSDVVIVYDTTAVKSAIAKCYPQDTFDYDTGVAIAYARLKEIEIPKVEEEPEFKRVGNGQEYYCIGKFNTARFGAVYTLETDHFLDKASFENNNYFHTRKRAEEVADKINLLLKLERLHDTYCPDYVPDWQDNARKYYVFYGTKDSTYYVGGCLAVDRKPCVYFPTTEIAQKVCDILNGETKNAKSLCGAC
ncbi:MAG: hypothetical protein ACLUJA_08820 [Ruminococcus bicirculans (ex Wegman et al. 2014)]|uniref:hypothetical protein n=1 Tax=Ruminococcus bicirculans (ex Wegman et al. 2014) TaxID=1160721 RepID=UPI003994C0B9